MSFASAQQPILFSNLTERDGLPFRMVRSLHFDSHGALWIGTEQGLGTYDAGVLSTVPLEPDRLPPGVADIQEDKAGMLWLGTTRGLYRIDPRTRAWKHWLLPWVKQRDGFLDAISSLCVGSDTNVYCGGQGGLFVFDPRTERFDSLTVNGHWPKNGGTILRSDSSGTGFWAGTVEYGLSYYSIKQHTLYYKDHNPGHVPILDGIRAESMAADANGDLWMANSSLHGIMRYSSGDRALRTWTHVPGDPNANVQGWTPMSADRRGRLWINDEHFLPLLFDPVDSTIRHFKNVPGDPSSFAGNFILDLATDAAGHTWLATSAGVSALLDEGFAYTLHRTGHVLNDRADMYISGFARAADSVLWLATEIGMVRFDPRTGDARRVEVLKGDERANAVLDVCNVNGELWLSTRRGIWVLDPRTEKTRQFTRYPKEAQHMLETIYAWCVQDHDGMLWAGTWGRGVVRIDPRSDACTYFKPDEDDPQALPAGVLVCAIVTRDGNVWLGRGSKGLARYNKATGHFERFPLTVNPDDPKTAIVYAMKEDPSGRLWLSVKNAGLVRYEPSTGDSKSYGFPHGLRATAPTSIQRDKRGRIWVGTSNQLACFDPEQERFIDMPVDPGTPFLDFGGASFELDQDDFFFTSTNMLVRFDPLAFNVPPAPAEPSLREVHVYNQRLPWLTGDTLVFSYEQDQLDLRFGTPTLPRAITTYSYFLEGSSREWVTSNSGLASFNNLAPGHYTLRMKVQDRWGSWSEESRASFTIVPPWWQRLWARILGAVLLAVVIVLIFRLRLEYIRKRERQEETQALAMNELKLRALRAQMNPHFVFNSLNSIDRYIMGEDRKKASHYLNRFAKLIRLILQQSDRTTVPLDREVEMLNYYLELEALRFNTPFTYSVKVDPLLHDEPIELPAMLVQPFVENAIWHGLQHKEGAGHIDVNFRLVNDDLECTVEDNGIGRKASAEINAQRSGVHRSMGMSVTTDRIELLRTTRPAKVTIHDLADREGKALGTRVVIILPLAAAEEKEEESADPGLRRGSENN